MAAGHRPCAECRHARFLDFYTAWRLVHPLDGGSQSRLTAEEIARRPHAERVTANRSKQTFTAALDELPDGGFVTLEASGEHAYLV